jgi:hypothetical protein
MEIQRMGSMKCFVTQINSGNTEIVTGILTKGLKTSGNNAGKAFSTLPTKASCTRGIAHSNKSAIIR